MMYNWVKWVIFEMVVGVRTKNLPPCQNFFVYSLYIFIFSIKVKIKKWGIFQTGGNR